MNSRQKRKIIKKLEANSNHLWFRLGKKFKSDSPLFQSIQPFAIDLIINLNNNVWEEIHEDLSPSDPHD